MFVKPRWLNNVTVPTFRLDGKILKVVTDYKYLGVVITDDMKDDVDIAKQMRLMYARGNSLIRRFSHCSNEVKIKLFKAYCSNIYCCYLWVNYNKSTLRRLVRAYSRIFKNFLKVDDYKLVNTYMMSCSIDSLPVIVRKLVNGFRSSIFKSDNNIVTTITKSLFFISSSLSMHWIKVLF